MTDERTRNERITNNVDAMYYIKERGSLNAEYVWRTALRRHSGDEHAAAAELARLWRAKQQAKAG